VSSYFKFLRRVRIHGRECGAVARALPHKIEAIPLSAVDKKVLSTTNERKVMSNSTFFKRIALTAIAALGLGMLSVAPSNATVTAHTLTIDSATDAVETGDTATAVLTHSFVNLSSAQDSVTLQAIVTSSNASTSGTIRMTITDSYTSDGNDGTDNNSASYFNGLSANDAYATFKAVNEQKVDSMTIAHAYGANKAIGTVINLSLVGIDAAGTYTVTVYTLTHNSGVASGTATTVSATWTVTVTDVASTRSATNSTATLRTGNASGLLGTGAFFGGTAEGTDSQTLGTATSTATDLTPEFTLLIKQKDGTSTNLAQDSYTVNVTGEAFVTKGTELDGTAVLSYGTGTRPNTSTGLKYLRMATGVADSVTAVHIWSTGTAGTATITATTDAGLVLASKTVTFSGKATTLAVTTTTKKVIEAGTGTASTAAFRVTATDAGGRAVLGVSPVIVSDNVAAISGGSCSDASGAVTDGVYSCDVNPVITSTSGMAATLTIRIPDPAVTTATAADGPNN